MVEALRPATLAFTEDGTPWSEAYGDVYHAAAGGPGQAEHVFLHGNHLPDRWRDMSRFTILETGFGTGLNFLATWAAWRASPEKPARLHYLGAEKHPFNADDLKQLHARWPVFSELATILRGKWPVLVPGYHRIELDDGRVVLTLLLGDAAVSLPRLVARVDAFFLDGFAPTRNPDLWTPELFKTLAKLAAPDATLATWSVAGPVREALRAAGFVLEKCPGYGTKREMLVGRYAPPPYRPAAPMPTPPGERHAIVLGAGLAGTACCARLAARGWTVELIERHRSIAAEASGNHAGIFHPLLARDDSIQARLTRAAFLHGLRAWSGLEDVGHHFPWAANGLAQLARDDEHEALQRDLPKAMAYPESYVEFLDADALGRTVGHAVPVGGWRVSRGGWANPGGLCRAYLDQAGERVHARLGVTIMDLRREADHWRAVDDQGSTIAEAPHVIVANGLGARTLACTAPLPMQRVRGQVTLIPKGLIPGVALALCREGYVTPALRDLHCAGASYDLDADSTPRPECDQGNLQRLARLIGDRPGTLDLARLSSRVGFRAVPPDRLPLVGSVPDFEIARDTAATHPHQLPRQPGMHALLGYASRGIIWSALMAETLVSTIEGEALPIEHDLVDAIDPGRFLLKVLRKGKGPT
jgi:tRNA 5-methylaminomethyl-2-thiouridine biosynthesis bifunctional protein